MTGQRCERIDGLKICAPTSIVYYCVCVYGVSLSLSPYLYLSLYLSLSTSSSAEGSRGLAGGVQAATGDRRGGRAMTGTGTL